METTKSGKKGVKAGIGAVAALSAMLFFPAPAKAQTCTISVPVSPCPGLWYYQPVAVPCGTRPPQYIYPDTRRPAIPTGHLKKQPDLEYVAERRETITDDDRTRERDVTVTPEGTYPKDTEPGPGRRDPGVPERRRGRYGVFSEGDGETKPKPEPYKPTPVQPPSTQPVTARPTPLTGPTPSVPTPGRPGTRSSTSRADFVFDDTYSIICFSQYAGRARELMSLAAKAAGRDDLEAYVQSQDLVGYRKKDQDYALVFKYTVPRNRHMPIDEFVAHVRLSITNRNIGGEIIPVSAFDKIERVPGDYDCSRQSRR